MAAWKYDLGTFASEILALADIVSKGWDNAGAPRVGMFFYDTSTNQTKTYQNNVWVAQGSAGQVSCLGITQSGQPLANELLTIGADVYEFDGVGANINVPISLVDAEGTLDNLLAAAVASGTENLFWTKLSATQLLLLNADGPQGTVTPGSQNIACVEAVTNYVLNPPTPTNLNQLGGVAATPQQSAHTSLTVQANMVSAGATVRLYFPFLVARFFVQVMTAAGAVRSGYTDTFTLDSGDVIVTFAAGGAGDLVATDVVHVQAWSA